MKALIDFTKSSNLKSKSHEANKAEVANRRFVEETKGLTLNGVPFATSRDSQNLITGATMSALIDSSYVCKWKTQEGFVEYNASEIISIAQTIRSHVQSCFDREAQLYELIDTGDYETSMIDEGWPNGIYNNA